MDINKDLKTTNWAGMIFVGLVALVIIIIILNPPAPPTPPKVQAIVPAKIITPKQPSVVLPPGEVTCRIRVQRGSDFLESNYYIGNQEIAYQKIFADGRIEQNGDIPNGKVKFFNEYDKTFGEEFYKNNRKHGLFKVYFEGGALKSESVYRNGRLIKSKEYYPNGDLRFEVSYEDLKYTADPKDKEVGIGKLYFPNGKLKYEWNITRGSKIGYKRSYNQDGTLRFEAQYDEFGKLIK